MRIRGGRSRALVITAVALALAAGCSSRGPAAGTPRPEKTDLNVAVVPALDSAGFFVALYGGLFKAHGLNVHFTPATSSQTVIADQVKGQFDITLGNYVSYIQAQQRRAADLYIFAEASVMEPATQGIYTMPDSEVTDLSGLVGKTIAINAPKNILYLLAASVLAEHGITPPQPIEDRGRGCRGCQHPDPGRRLVARHASFGDGRHIRQRRRALLAADRERPVHQQGARQQRIVPVHGAGPFYMKFGVCSSESTWAWAGEKPACSRRFKRPSCMSTRSCWKASCPRATRPGSSPPAARMISAS